MPPLKLSNRLRSIASFVSPLDSIADIGTDHALLPIWLILNNISTSAVASDLHPLPLMRAQSAAYAFGLSDSIRFFLSDGLANIPPHLYDTLIIAGMGGHSIINILSQLPAPPPKKLILQPMSKLFDLASFLYNSGFFISNELLAADSDSIYRIILAQPGTAPTPAPHFLHAGLPLLLNRDPLLPLYLDSLISKTNRILNALQLSNSPSPSRSASLLELLSGFISMKERSSLL